MSIVQNIIGAASPWYRYRVARKHTLPSSSIRRAAAIVVRFKTLMARRNIPTRVLIAGTDASPLFSGVAGRGRPRRRYDQLFMIDRVLLPLYLWWGVVEAALLFSDAPLSGGSAISWGFLCVAVCADLWPLGFLLAICISQRRVISVVLMGTIAVEWAMRKCIAFLFPFGGVLCIGEFYSYYLRIGRVRSGHPESWEHMLCRHVAERLHTEACTCFLRMNWSLERASRMALILGRCAHIIAEGVRRASSGIVSAIDVLATLLAAAIAGAFLWALCTSLLVRIIGSIILSLPVVDLLIRAWRESETGSNRRAALLEAEVVRLEAKVARWAAIAEKREHGEELSMGEQRWVQRQMAAKPWGAQCRKRVRVARRRILRALDV